MHAVLNPKRLTIFLGSVVVFLALAHICSELSGWSYHHLFDLDREENIPARYSLLILLLSSGLLIAIAFTERNKGARFVYWLGLGTAFLFLGIDEWRSIHEHLGGSWNTSGLLFFAWIIPYGIAVGIFALLYLRFLLNLPRRFGVLFIIAGLIFITGAMGFEALGGRHTELHGRTGAYVVYATIEEILEMVGVVVFIYALTSYIDTELGGLRLRLPFRAKSTLTSHE